MGDQKSKAVFKNFCTENNLRYKVDDCGNPISPSSIRKFGADHLWWTGTDDGKIGISVRRPGTRGYNKLRKKLLSMGCELVQDGEMEGNFLASEKVAVKVGKLLHTAKRKGAAARSKRMKALWDKRKKEAE